MFTDVEWNRLQAAVPIRAPEERHEPWLLQSILRCQRCRHTMQPQRDRDTYRCGNDRCTAKVQIQREQVEPVLWDAYVRERAKRTLRLEPAGDDVSTQMAELARAIASEELDLEEIRSDRRMRRESRETWEAQIRDAEKALAELRDRFSSLQGFEREQAEGDNLTIEEIDALPMEAKRRIIHGYFPIVFCRRGRYYDENSQMRELPIKLRLLVVAASRAAKYKLPTQGSKSEPVGPVDFGDGFEPLTQRHVLLGEKKQPDTVLPLTPEEVLAQVAEHGGNIRQAALALGLHPQTMYSRVAAAKSKLGIVEVPIAEQLARKRFKERGRTDEEVVAALELNDGNRAKAAKTLGMSLSAIKCRVVAMQKRGTPVPIRDGRARRGRTDDEVLAALEQHKGDLKLAAEETGIKLTTLKNRLGTLRKNGTPVPGTRLS